MQILHLQIRPPGLVTCIATLPGFVQLALSVGIDLVSSSARVTSNKSATTGPIDRTPGTPGSDKNMFQI